MKLLRNIKRFLKWLQSLTTKPIVRIPTITLLAWAISHTIIYDITSASIFAPIEKSNDFEMSDIYNVVVDARPVRSLNPNIVVVGIDQCSRSEIGNLLQIINLSDPKAIGLDVIFGFYSEEDTTLINILDNCKNIVLANDAQNLIGTVFAPRLNNVHWGAINFFTKKHSGIVRHFRPQFGDSLYAFSAEIARLSNKEAFDHLLQRNKEFETICYPSQEFTIIEGKDVLLGNIDIFDFSNALADKIVLMGDVNNPLDQHQTPVNAEMPGIIINAHALSTIYDNLYIDAPSENTNWIIAIIISLLFSSIIVGCQSSTRIKSYTTFILRAAQILLMTSFIYIGCYSFARWHFYCNFAPSLLMIGLGILSSAIEPMVGLSIRAMLRTIEHIIPISLKTRRYVNQHKKNNQPKSI